MRFPIAFTSSVLLLPLFLFHLGAAISTYRIGVLDNAGNLTATYLQWSPTFSTYVNAQAVRVGADFNVTTIPLAYADLNNAVAQRTVDLVYTNTGHAAILQQRYNMHSVASVENQVLGKTSTMYGGVVVTYNTSGVQQLTDCALPGKRLCGTDSSAFGGYSAQLAELCFADACLSQSQKDAVRFLATHEAVLNATQYLQCDCGFIRTHKFEQGLLLRPQQLTRVVQVGQKQGLQYSFFPFRISTVLYPEWVIVAFNDGALTSEDESVLLAMLTSLRTTDAAVVTGQYSRWFPPLSLAAVFEAQWAAGVLERPKGAETPALSTQAVILIAVLAPVAVIAFGFFAYSFISRRLRVWHAPKKPTEPLCVMFAALKNETLLFERYPETVGVASEKIAVIVRHAVAKHECYESKLVSGAFLIAASNVNRALACAAVIQSAIKAVDWSSILGEPIARQSNRKRKGGDSVSVVSEGQTAKARRRDDTSSRLSQSQMSRSHVSHSRASSTHQPVAIEMSIGIHWGVCRHSFDSVAYSFDYSGPTVNTCAVVADYAQGRQTLITAAAAQQLHDNASTEGSAAPFSTIDVDGNTGLQLFQFTPTGTAALKFEVPKDTAGGGLAAAVEQQASGVAQKLVTVISIFTPNFEGLQRTAPREAVAQAYGDAVNTIHALVQKEKGHIHSWVSGRLIISFNCAGVTPHQSSRAASVALAIIDICPGASAGLASGRVLVGQFSASDAFKHHAIIGPVAETATSLESYARRLGVPVLTTYNLFEDLSTTMILQIVDVANVSGSVTALVAVMDESNQDADEWMYQLQNADRTNPYYCVNELFVKAMSSNADFSALLEAIANLQTEVQLHGLPCLKKMCVCGSIATYISQQTVCL